MGVFLLIFQRFLELGTKRLGSNYSTDYLDCNCYLRGISWIMELNLSGFIIMVKNALCFMSSDMSLNATLVRKTSYIKSEISDHFENHQPNGGF